jgi:hypothetical protein
MPAVASGRREWTVEERGHLASCSDCASEWKLVQAASALGRDVTVNAATLTPLVLERVRTAKVQEQRSRWVRRTAIVTSLGMAAMLLLVMLPGRRKVTPSGLVVAAAPAELRLAELDDAAPAELEMVLVELDETAATASSLDGPDLEGLDESQVERALRSWEES